MNHLTEALHIPDTQSERDERHLAIQRVGVKDVRYPLTLKVAGWATAINLLLGGPGLVIVSPGEVRLRPLIPITNEELVLTADLDHRAKAGDKPRIEDYLGKFPELGPVDRLPDRKSVV